jgi:hypothetical protein
MWPFQSLGTWALRHIETDLKALRIRNEVKAMVCEANATALEETAHHVVPEIQDACLAISANYRRLAQRYRAVDRSNNRP